MPPNEFFFMAAKRCWVDRAEILHSFWGSICVVLQKKTESGQVTELYRSYTELYGTFYRKRVLSTLLGAINWDGYIRCVA